MAWYPGRERSFLPSTVPHPASATGGFHPIEYTRSDSGGIILPREELVDLMLRGKERLDWQAARSELPHAALRKAETRVVGLFFDIYQKQQGRPGQSLRETLMHASPGIPQVEIIIEFDGNGNRLEDPIMQPFGLPIGLTLEALERNYDITTRQRRGGETQSHAPLKIPSLTQRDNVWNWLAYELWEHAGGYDALTNIVNAGSLLDSQDPKNRIIHFKS